MKFQKILMIGYEKDNIIEKEWERIETLCDELIIASNDSDEIEANLSGADCLLLKLGAGADKNMIDKAPNLKYIGMFGTGYGRIDTDYATSKGITICNIAGYSTEGVSELVFALILEHVRDISRAKIEASQGNYSETGFSGTEISNKKFGIIGMGNIGSRVSQIASNGFNANVVYWSRTKKPNVENDKVVYQKDLKTLIQECDFISLHLPFTADTEKFINEELINAIRSGAIIINTSPMELVDIGALKKRLQKNDITFILDHSDELTKEQAEQLAQYKNCIMYPPIGYITNEATLKKQSMFVDNLQNFLNGNPTNKVN